MGTLSTTRFAAARDAAEQTFDSFKSGMHHVFDRVMTKPDGSPSRVRTWTNRATDAIKAHPYLAVGVAVGLGYAIVRVARR
ncbi:MAG TPA: hypothetical protein VIV11_17725 [Kofleriaceae bacterium]